MNLPQRRALRAALAAGAGAVTAIEEYLPRKPVKGSFLLVEVRGVPNVWPVMRAHLRGHTVALVLLFVVVGQNDMDVVTLLVGLFAVDAFSLAKIRIMRIHDERHQTHYRSLAQRSNFGRQITQYRAVL